MILVVNAGSSTMKFKVYDQQFEELAGGIMERLGLRRSFLEYHINKKNGRRSFAGGIGNHTDALREIITVLDEENFAIDKISTIGHRVVHGGEEFVDSVKITSLVLDRLKRYNALAPLHNPANLAGIQASMKLFPRAKQVAVFDTSFYSTLPDYAYTYALPEKYYHNYGVRKYGFHGISHRYVTTEAAKKLKKSVNKINLITCHLGGGSSVTAIKNGQAVDTSMGFTPLQGLTMATRCGDIDPFIPLLMMEKLKLTTAEVYEVLNQESGLLGLTGYADMREILVTLGNQVEGVTLKSRPTKQEYAKSQLAFNKYCYDVARYIGQYLSILGRVDAIVFTAGIGERSAIVRNGIMSFVNAKPKPKTLVINTNEELEIAKETLRF